MLMTPQSMTGELDRLRGDLLRLTGELHLQLDELVSELRTRSTQEVIVVGHGDSLIAGLAAEMAFSSVAGVRFRALHAQYFVDYVSHWMRSPERTLVIGVSASGNTARTVQAIEAARKRGAGTLAITGSRESAAMRVADRTLLVELPDKQPSPGIRSYQASLAALLMLAVSFGPSRQLIAELTKLPAIVGATVCRARSCCDSIAASIARAPVLTLAGTGPGYAAALYGAAKMVEAAGFAATGQDLEDWWHIERFQRPFDLPLIVLAAPGHSRRRALELAGQARVLGRFVVAVGWEGDSELIGWADAAIPVCGEVSEELSPLLYHIYGGTLAAALARALGRNPFDTGPVRGSTDLLVENHIDAQRKL